MVALIAPIVSDDDARLKVDRRGVHPTHADGVSVYYFDRRGEPSCHAPKAVPTQKHVGGNCVDFFGSYRRLNIADDAIQQAQSVHSGSHMVGWI